MSEKGRLLVLIGPSGSGKSTVLKEVLHSTPNTFLSISATTRPPREGEKHGTHYYFLSGAEFQRMVASGGLLEYANYVDHFYGTPKEAVLHRLAEGKNVILEIEVQGAIQIREKYPEAVLIFILPPSLAVLKDRLVGRHTEDKATVDARLRRAVEEIHYAYECDYVVVNDTIEAAVEKVRSIILSLSCEKSRMKSRIDEVLESNY